MRWRSSSFSGLSNPGLIASAPLNGVRVAMTVVRPWRRPRSATAVYPSMSPSADLALGLFVVHGFDRVTVADVARVADVSVNTVFNYFRTKEDLFFDRAEVVEDLPARVVRERAPGESAVAALRRDFLEALEQRDYRIGFVEGAETFARLVDESEALRARARLISDRREEALARALADEVEADPGDITPWLVAAQINAVQRHLINDIGRRKLAGQTLDEMYEDVREAVERAFDLLESGVGDYAVRTS